MNKVAIWREVLGRYEFLYLTPDDILLLLTEINLDTRDIASIFMVREAEVYSKLARKSHGRFDDSGNAVLRCGSVGESLLASREAARARVGLPGGG